MMTGAAERGLWVVGLVASTGGLDALGQVLAPLPADFPALGRSAIDLDGPQLR